MMSKAVFFASLIPFLYNVIFHRDELAFQLDWDDQVNFVENTILDSDSGSFMERAQWATGERGIFLGVWEPFSLWVKIILAETTSMMGGGRALPPGSTASSSTLLHGHHAMSPLYFALFASVVHGFNAVLLARVTVSLAPLLVPPSRLKREGDAGWRAGACVGALLWALHPMRVEVVCWMSCLPYLLATCATLSAVSCLIPLILGGSPSSSLSSLLQVVGVSLFYLVAVLSKAAALPCLGLLLVLHVFFSPMPRSVTPSSNQTTATTTTGSSSRKSNSSRGRATSSPPTTTTAEDSDGSWTSGSGVAGRGLAFGLALPALLRLGFCVGVFAFGASRALWANAIGMEITAEHPQNALKVPRHIDTEGFALRVPSSSSEEAGGSEEEGGGYSGGGTPPPGLMSADWWWQQAMVHRLAKAAFSLAWYVGHTLWPRGLCIFYPVDRDFHASQVVWHALAVAVGTVLAVAATLRLLFRRACVAGAAALDTAQSPASAAATTTTTTTTRKSDSSGGYGDRKSSSSSSSSNSKAAVAVAEAFQFETTELIAVTWLCAVGLLLPTLGLGVAHGWPIFAADRYAYLPAALAVPWCAAVGRRVVVVVVTQGSQPRGRRLGKASVAVLRGSVALLALSLGVQSLAGCRKWAHSGSLWAHAVAHGPSDVVAHYNLGCVLERSGQSRQAGQLFEAALQHDDSYGAAWNNWGFVREREGDVRGAEECYRRAVALNPDRHYTAHNNLAKLLHVHRSSTHGNEVEHHYREAVRIFPTYGTALYNLATWLQTHLPPPAISLPPLSAAPPSPSSSSSSSSSSPAAEAAAAEAAWFEEVAGLYRGCVMSAPNLREAYHNLAALLLNHHADALEHLTTANGEAEAMATARARLIEAKQLLQFAVKTFPGYQRAAELIPAVDAAWKNLQPPHG